jgi:outer membrane protein assembly factor BamB
MERNMRSNRIACLRAHRTITFAAAFVAVSFADRVALAGDWPQWRGPTLDGVSADKGTPLEWSDSKNVLWKAPLPCWGGATPIVVGERVFVVTPSAAEGDAKGSVVRQLPGPMGGRETPGGRDILVLCLNAGDGKLVWQKTLDSRNALFGKQNLASCSPVSDGKFVWALSGAGMLACFDAADGNERWRINISEKYGEFELLWGYASSPLLYDGKLYVQVLHGGGRMANKDKTGEVSSYLLAIDAAKGDVLWKHERKTDAKSECPDAYTTPTIGRHGGRVDLIVSGADYVTGHDPADGKERWRAAGLNPNREGNYRICPSPVVMGEYVIAPTRRRPLLALRGGGSGDVSTSHLAWKLERGGPDVPTPVSDGKYVYVVEDKGLVTCVDLATGDLVWGPERTATGSVSASPLLADGKVYIVNEAGVTTVLAAGAEFKVLATNELDGTYTLSSPAVANGRLFVRTSKFLYCIGGK